MPRTPKRISGPLAVGIGASSRVRHIALRTLILHEVASGGRATLSEISGAHREGSSAKRAFQAAIWEDEGTHDTSILCVMGAGAFAGRSGEPSNNKKERTMQERRQTAVTAVKGREIAELVRLPESIYSDPLTLSKSHMCHSCGSLCTQLTEGPEVQVS